MIRQLALCLFCIPDGVQEEGASLLEAPEHVILVKVCRYVARHEIGSVDKIGRTDGMITETEM